MAGWTAPVTHASPQVPPAPPGFRVVRSVDVGSHPLLEVFPGLEQLPTARRQTADLTLRRRLYRDTTIEVVREDVWMYVSPNKRPRLPRLEPKVTPDRDAIVVGLAHLRESPDLILFLDIFHELQHILQRWRGEELFDRPEDYVSRPTELEAYRFVVEEARGFGVSDEVLRDYLLVEWITDGQYRALLAAMNVPPPPST